MAARKKSPSDHENGRDENHEQSAILELVEEDPLMALAIAAGLGFFVGGGLRSAAGVGLITIIARTAAKELAGEFAKSFAEGDE
jgi:hypothetical protein